MKRTTTPSSRANMPKGMIWSSLKPRISTQFTFTGHRPSAAGCTDAGQHVVVSVGHAGDAGEAVGIDGVHADGDAAQAGILERLRHIGQQMAVGGERDVEFVAIGGAQLGQLADEIDHALAQQRLAAGDADFLDSKSDQHARHAQIVGKRQIAVERALVPGAAVNTLVVAAVGDRDPQIGDGAAEFVGERHSFSIRHSAT